MELEKVHFTNQVYKMLEANLCDGHTFAHFMLKNYKHWSKFEKNDWQNCFDYIVENHLYCGSYDFFYFVQNILGIKLIQSFLINRVFEFKLFRYFKETIDPKGHNLFAVSPSVNLSLEDKENVINYRRWFGKKDSLLLEDVRFIKIQSIFRIKVNNLKIDEDYDLFVKQNKYS